MTIEEKLAHFQDAAIEDVKKKKAGILREYRETLDREFARHKESVDLQMKQDLEARTVFIHREMNRDLSAGSLEIKHRLSAEQQKLTDNIFGEVKEKLLRFKETPEYTEYLIRLIASAKELAGDDEVKIGVDPEDAPLIPGLEEKTGMKIETTDGPVLGGIEARIEARNVLIDETFGKALEEARENYRFEEVM